MRRLWGIDMGFFVLASFYVSITSFWLQFHVEMNKLKSKSTF